MTQAENPKEEVTSDQRVAIFVILAIVLSIFAAMIYSVAVYAENGYNGTGTVISKSTQNKKCFLEVKREDGKTETRSAGWRNECGKYSPGQTVYYDHGIIDDKPASH